MSKIRDYWLGLSIAIKMRLFIVPLLLVITVAAGFNMYTTRFSVQEVNRLLLEISRCENAQDAMRAEKDAFLTFVRAPGNENRESLEQMVTHTTGTISLLPYDYQIIGAERYAWTWRIKNAYRNYADQRDSVLNILSVLNSPYDDDYISVREEDVVDQLYEVYDMQEYLEGYMQSLSLLTVDYASSIYDRTYPMLQSIPYLQVLVFLVLIIASSILVHLLTETILTPIQALAEDSRHISQGRLEQEDVSVSSRDELGELVDSFNHMKHATRRSIQTLEENQRLSDQLHQEAMERAEMEKRLETTRMDLLQSQIKPHFLFNTLNTISGMAELEDAEKTDSMIRSLSRLFRYNLHTTDQFVSLFQELEVARDYLYLQKMRFGDRVQYELPDPDRPGMADIGNTMVPVFLLQPLVENSIIHGIAKKEQGGKITISTTKDDLALRIRVSDTGEGMDPDTLAGLRRKLSGEPSDVHVGIGLGNLYQRLLTLYGEGSMQIESRPGEGTQIDIIIPIQK